MSGKDSPQKIIDSYKKKQTLVPMIIIVLAALLLITGIVMIVLWLTSPGGNAPAAVSDVTETVEITETATETPIPPTATETLIPTETLTPTLEMTNTPSGPFEYTVQEDDNCYDIAVQFEVDLVVLLAINNLDNTCPIQAGQTILIPAPDQELPTETPLPEDLAYGTEIEYTVKSGDNLDIIASKFNSTVDSIMDENDIEDQNNIFIGQKLVIKVNIVTPTPTLAATSTVEPGAEATQSEE